MARVLIVDDSATMRTVLRRCVTFAGVDDADIAEVDNGAAALERIEGDPPDLVLCDVNMPIMTGDQLLRELNQRGLVPTLPVVMVTSHAGARQAIELVRLGARKVVRKPFNPQSLHTELEEYLVPPEAEVAFDAPVSVPLGEQDPAAARRERLAESVERTLEQIAFTLPVRTDAVPSRQILYQARIKFESPEVGELRVAVTRRGASILCRNLVGDDPEDDDVARCDAVAELANVLAGEVFDPTEEPRFGLPAVSVLSPGVDLGAPLSFALDLDGPPELLVQFATAARASEVAVG
jgi:two-component system chemotaxis response regulator CheY